MQIAQLLLEAGADVNWRNVRGNTALDMALEKGHGDLVRLLLRFGAHMPRARAQTTLWRARMKHWTRGDAGRRAEKERRELLATQRPRQPRMDAHLLSLLTLFPPDEAAKDNVLGYHLAGWINAESCQLSLIRGLHPAAVKARDVGEVRRLLRLLDKEDEDLSHGRAPGSGENQPFAALLAGLNPVLFQSPRPNRRPTAVAVAAATPAAILAAATRVEPAAPPRPVATASAAPAPATAPTRSPS